MAIDDGNDDDNVVHPLTEGHPSEVSPSLWPGRQKVINFPFPFNLLLYVWQSPFFNLNFSFRFLLKYHPGEVSDGQITNDEKQGEVQTEVCMDDVSFYSLDHCDWEESFLPGQIFNLHFEEMILLLPTSCS